MLAHHLMAYACMLSALSAIIEEAVQPSEVHQCLKVAEAL